VNNLKIMLVQINSNMVKVVSILMPTGMISR